MDSIGAAQIVTVMTSPLTFAVLVAAALFLGWLAFSPARARLDERARLEDYLDRADIIELEEMERSLFGRILIPFLRRILRLGGRLAPRRNVARTEEMLVQAGRPGRMTALDFYGVRILFTVLVTVGYLWLFGRSLPVALAVQNALLISIVGYFLPLMWLRRRVRLRREEIARALPDALDMLTVGVEAGLGFESALLKVGDRWDNELTREFRRAVADMRIGSSRNVALRRMAERTGVSDLSTFVAVLIQSSQLGVSIAQVLHSQAAQMRIRRRQRAEELARQAGVKMIFPLGFLIFPALLVVILGPSIPGLLTLFASLGGSTQLP